MTEKRKIEEIVREMDDYNIGIQALQEIRRKREGIIDNKMKERDKR